MASESWPNTGHNSGAVTTTEWEQMVHAGLGTGLVGTPSDTAVVYADSSGMQVKIRAGKRAVVRGAAWYSGATDITVAISANASGSTRIDVVVLRLTKATGVVAEAVVEGTPGAGVPALTRDIGTTGTYEFPIARVTVTNGAATIAAGNVNLDGWYLAPHPVAGVTTTLPDTADQGPGMLVYDTEADAVYVSSGGGLRTVYADTGWLNVPMQSGWATDAFSVAKYRRLNGVVHVIFGAKRTGASLSAGTNSTLGQLPSGFRPAHTMRFAAVINNTGYANAVAVLDTSGNLTISGYGVSIPQNKWVYFPPISFPV